MDCSWGGAVPNLYTWGIVKIMVPFLGPYYNTGPNLGTQKGTIILTIPHMIKPYFTGRRLQAALQDRCRRKLREENGPLYQYSPP